MNRRNFLTTLLTVPLAGLIPKSVLGFIPHPKQLEFMKYRGAPILYQSGYRGGKSNFLYFITATSLLHFSNPGQCARIDGIGVEDGRDS